MEEEVEIEEEYDVEVEEEEDEEEDEEDDQIKENDEEVTRLPLKFKNQNITHQVIQGETMAMHNYIKD
jgi:hypothetical protein